MKAAQQHPRVVSLLPSATDIIAVAGGVDLLVGRSHECNWPSQVERLPILTGAVNEFVDSKQMDDVVKASLDRGEGLYFLEQELLKKLQPDVILTQDLCNVCSVDLQLVQQTIDQLSIKPKIVALNPQKLSYVLEDIIRVGKAVGREQQSRTAVTVLQQRVHDAQAAAQTASKGNQPIKVFILLNVHALNLHYLLLQFSLSVHSLIQVLTIVQQN
jgi:iron complex transport system substrate-binding protein